MRRFAPLSLMFLLAGLSGCLTPTGLVYHDTTYPLDRDLNNTLEAPDSEGGEIKRFTYSLVDIAWDSAGIGEISAEAKKKSGFETLYYADIETFRILWIWTQRKVHVYGTEAAPAPTAAP